MANEIRLPKLGMTMTDATFTEWVVPDGSPVHEGDVVARIETDKVEQDLEAPAAGTLVHRAEEGEIYDVGDLLAEIV